jgi:hypothetical protein
MTDDPNHTSELEPRAPEPAAGGLDLEPGGEAAEDLNASELEAAASAAESDFQADEGELGEEAIEGDEAAWVVEAPPAVAPGAGNLERPVARPGTRAQRGPKPARTVFAVDPSLRIKDPVSAAFVVGTVLVFVLIFANAMAFGHGGAFTKVPTPAPIASPGASPSEGPSSSPGAPGSPAVSPSIAPSVAPTVALSPSAS